jgi:hypothetical protein
MGALAFKGAPPDLQSALKRFSKPEAIRVRELADGNDPTKKEPRNAEDAVLELGFWLKDWRSHGRTVEHRSAKPPNPPHNMGFDPFAKNDHDRGAASLTGKGRSTDVTYRPAIGLPIIQRFQNGGTVSWDESWNPQCHKGEGRFASPVLLRPHRDAQGKWHALVIFVDAHKWPVDKKVYLNGQERSVSLGLYEAMKEDARLKPFP